MTGLRILPPARRGAGAGPAAGRAGGGPGADGPAPSFGVGAWLRWVWRQLTSMRTALLLLFLLAVASVPGSLLPQEGIDPASVQQFYTAHPLLAPILGRLWLFNVFAAPWFAAIYLLLFLSLAGCVFPRTVRLVGTARQEPPQAPRNLSRLPLAVRYRTALTPEAALAAASRELSGRRFRVRAGDGWVSGEKGYLREAGNLLFHLSLLGVLVAVGMGGLFGYKANRVLVQGTSFANTVTQLDAFHPGRAVSAADLQPFSITLRKFTASYVTSGMLRGQPSSFNAHVSYTPLPGAPARTYNLRVNHPLNVDNVKVFLIGHGYAPIFKVTDGQGRVVFDQAVPFIAVGQNGLTSEGVVKVPDARPHQLGFVGVFLPSTVDAGGRLQSDFPAPLNPMVSMIAYAGDLGMNSGPPQSVYQLDTSRLHRLPAKVAPLAPGESMRLPGGNGTLTFVGYKPWVSLSITYDPGTVPALVAGLAALAGLLLSFFVRRRRMFVRARAGPGGGTVVEVGGLARSDASGGFENEFASLAGRLTSVHEGSRHDTPAEAPGAGPDAPAADEPASLTDTPEGE